MTTARRYRQRDDVKEQILQAAQALLAERPPSQVTVRDVARRAGVQHSLVHRHFETKERLVEAVLERTHAAYADAVAPADGPAEAFTLGMAYMADHRATFAAMLRAVMETDGDPVTLFPGFAVHLQRVADVTGGAGAPPIADADDAGDGVEPRVLVLALMALTSGWAFLEDQWLASAGFHPEDRDRVRAQLATLIEHVLEREGGPLLADRADPSTG